MALKGFISKILSVVSLLRLGVNVTEIKVDPGGGAIETDDLYSSPGEDSKPLLTDSVFSVPSQGNGKNIAIGFIDPLNISISENGEKRIYSRNNAGIVQAEIFLKKDKSIQIKNARGFINITPTGDIELNGKTDFAVGFTNLLLGFNQLVADHNTLVGLYNAHQQVVNPTTFIAEPPVAQALPSVADISSSKVDKVKV